MLDCNEKITEIICDAGSPATMESKRNTRNKLSTDFLLFPNKIRRLSIRELHSKLPLKKAVYHS